MKELIVVLAILVVGYAALGLYFRHENKKFSKMYDELKREIEGEDDG